MRQTGKNVIRSIKIRDANFYTET